jgi:hypothetical protein
LGLKAGRKQSDGAPGVVAGVTVFDSAEAVPVPMALIADTWNR